MSVVQLGESSQVMSPNKSVPQLTKTNYDSWSQRFKAFLDVKTLSKWLTTNPSKNNTEQGRLQRKHDKKALAYLRLSINDEFLEKVSDTETCKAAFDKITDYRAIHQPESVHKESTSRKLPSDQAGRSW